MSGEPSVLLAAGPAATRLVAALGELSEVQPRFVIAELEEPIDRLFTGAHLWAIQTAAPLRIRAGDVSALVPVATVAALLATKLHAYSSPRRNPDKRPGDALDVLRLGRMLVQGAEMVGASPVVGDAVRWAMTSWHEAPNDVARRLRGLGANAPRVTEGEIRALAELVVDAFASASSDM